MASLANTCNTVEQKEKEEKQREKKEEQSKEIQQMDADSVATSVNPSPPLSTTDTIILNTQQQQPNALNCRVIASITKP